MVLSEQQQNMEIVRNGRRNKDKEELGTRSPNSNNGHAISPSSSSEDENASSNKRIIGKKSGEYEAEKIRVGRDYQAVCPELVPTVERRPDQLNDRALLVWSPTKEITDIKLEEYISVAKDKYGYNGEQALGMLFWHKHDLERAVMDLANFTPFPDEWTIEDKVLFDQAFQFHGKSFHRIRQMLPDKSIPSLVKYYYSWKKTRSRTSVMDRQEKIKKNDGSENGSENGSNEDSDNEEKIQQNKQNVSSLKRKNSDASDELRPSDTNNLNNKQNARWNNEEVLLAVQGVKKFGKDFQAIADTIGTKTQAQVRLFYTNQRRRYDLDSAMREFQRNQQNLASNNNGTNGSSVGEIMEIDLDDDSLDNSTKVDAKDKSDSKELTIIPEGLDTNEITITKATSGDGSSAAKKFKVNDSAITITENSLLTPPSSQITITATTTTTPINSSSSVSAAAVGNSTTVIDDDDDDVIIEGTSMANTTSSGLKSAVSATIK